MTRSLKNASASYIEAHRNVYNALADEYNQRAERLREVTEKAASIFVQHLPPNAEVLELGCGSGLAAEILTSKGLKVSVIELSPKMVAIAQKRNPGITFITGDFLAAKFTQAFDGIFALAFIHLFPKQDALQVLQRCYSLLNNKGIFYIGTTKDEQSTEGWEEKKDYQQALPRFRKRWTQPELEQALTTAGFTIQHREIIPDPFGKVWMDYVAKKTYESS